MSMLRKLFTPGKGSVIQEFTTAVSDGTWYPGDWMAMNIAEAPAAQGVTAGEHRGQTLGTNDYIECTGLDSGNAGAARLALGVLFGKGVNSVSDWSTVTSDVVADGDVVVILSKGVAPVGRQADTAALGDYLSPSSTAGECLNATAAATLNDGIDEFAVGVAMAADAGKYTRASADDEDYAISWVNC